MDSVNKRMDIFVNMTSESFDELIEMSKLFGNVPSMLQSKVKGLEETNKVRQKFLNQAVKYQKNPIKFFEDEIENFNFVATKYLKKIGKLYAMAKDDENMNESIQNWDLHQKLMEKKYGKRKISTTYKYKNFK
jgi:DNA repair ATPase RecN